ncbi:MAG: hypothetical protein I3274_02680 [Candidatus Moeniiplasma glomeromycotorum]|nr:hypothetical protein [Candidatus Moeniiplasma glomeromycotorum]MCE8167510.1 hypothetical protein [Candidatus Moeniiplasma glomeromycotorum]
MVNKYKNLEEFFRHLEEPASNYPWIAKDLPENPTLEQRLKFEIYQALVNYKNKHNLTEEQLSEIILKDYPGTPNTESKIEKIKKILFGWIDDFELKELITYANHIKYILPNQLELDKQFEAQRTDRLTPWDASLNDRKIIEIVEKRLNQKTFEPLPEPLWLWKKVVFFLETTYRRIKYKMIFELEGERIRIRNIWVVS